MGKVHDRPAPRGWINQVGASPTQISGASHWDEVEDPRGSMWLVVWCLLLLILVVVYGVDAVLRIVRSFNLF